MTVSLRITLDRSSKLTKAAEDDHGERVADDELQMR